jgi:hypothetical protein
VKEDRLPHSGDEAGRHYTAAHDITKTRVRTGQNWVFEDDSWDRRFCRILSPNDFLAVSRTYQWESFHG